MQLNLIKIQSLLESSDLNNDEQKDFLNFLSGAHDEELSEFASFLEENPSWARKLYENHKKKRGFWTRSDNKSWQSIIDEELRDIEQLK